MDAKDVRTDSNGMYNAEDLGRYLHENSPKGQREKFIKDFKNVFDTQVACVCGKEGCTVMDRATLKPVTDPYAGRLGPNQPVNTRPALNHTYYGAKCALSYDANAFVQAHDYLPRESRRNGATKRSDLISAG